MPLLFNIAIEYTIRSVCTNQDEWKLNGTHQFVVYTDGVNAGSLVVHQGYFPQYCRANQNCANWTQNSHLKQGISLGYWN